MPFIGRENPRYALCSLIMSLESPLKQSIFLPSDADISGDMSGKGCCVLFSVSSQEAQDVC